MSNERLRAAIVSAGLSLAEVSDQLAVDPKTVERWITQGRLPHRRHRLAVAALLGEDDAFLWPATEDDPRSRSASAAEFVEIHANRGSISIATWDKLIDQATESIDLLAYSGSFLHDTIPDFGQRLIDKSRAGVQVRLLFGDPDSTAVAQRGQDEGIGDLMAARCRLTWAYLRPVLGTPGILARHHGCTLYSSMFRFDSTLLANNHMYGAPASHSPVLHLHRVPGGRLFTSYMLSFDRTWDQGNDVASIHSTAAAAVVA